MGRGKRENKDEEAPKTPGVISKESEIRNNQITSWKETEKLPNRSIDEKINRKNDHNGERKGTKEKEKEKEGGGGLGSVVDKSSHFLTSGLMTLLAIEMTTIFLTVFRYQSKLSI